MSNGKLPWISVKDELPPELVKVLCVFVFKDGYQHCDFGNCLNGEWYVSGYGELMKVTHWMPVTLPEQEEA